MKNLSSKTKTGNRSTLRGLPTNTRTKATASVYQLSPLVRNRAWRAGQLWTGPHSPSSAAVLKSGTTTGACAAAATEAASRAAEVVAAREQRAGARGYLPIAGGKRGVVDAAGGEVTRPRVRASQGVGASGVKRDCGVGSPSGSTVAAREAEEVEACKLERDRQGPGC
jgi:hypothetical protein